VQGGPDSGAAAARAAGAGDAIHGRHAVPPLLRRLQQTLHQSTLPQTAHEKPHRSVN